MLFFFFFKSQACSKIEWNNKSECLICYIFMRSVTASYYSWKSIRSLLSTPENHTRGNQIDFKTSMHITRCSRAPSPKVLAFLQWEGLKGRVVPPSLISLTCNSSELPHQLTPLHSISNPLTSRKLFKVEVRNPLWDCEEIYSFELVIFWPSYYLFNSVWLGVLSKFHCFLGNFGCWRPSRLALWIILKKYHICHVRCFSREDLKTQLQMSTSNCWK